MLCILNNVLYSISNENIYTTVPFMLGNTVDENDEHWEAFLSLWDICCLIVTFTVTHELAVKLAWLVENYLESVVDLYGESIITPKMHHLVHSPEQIEL